MAGFFWSALTQRFPHIPERENADKAPDARTNLELGPCVFVELRHFTDRRLRLPGQELDGALVMGFVAGIRVHRRARRKPAISKASFELDSASVRQGTEARSRAPNVKDLR